MRYGPKNLAVTFSAKSLTHFGGVFLLHQFFRKLHLRRLMQIIRFPQRNNRYSIPEMILSILYPMVLGLGRIETSYLLGHNGVFQYLTGLPSYPTPSALRRFLRRMHGQGLPQLIELHHAIRTKITRRMQTVIFDFDSTVLTVYGKQEQARIGYNPFKPGRASYHPLLCFEAQTQTSWHGVLRPGDAASGSASDTFLCECFLRIPASVQRVFVRGDAGFYDKDNIAILEENKACFCIVAKHTQPLKRAMVGASYKEFRHGWEASEFFYHPLGWNRAYRFVAIRHLLPQQDDESDAQLSLFPVTIGRYGYRAFVTNLPWLPQNVWKFYRQRAEIELIIKELKHEYPLGKIPTKYFASNESYFHLLLFAYDLVNWFQKLCVPKEYKRSGLNTLRRHLFAIPAELVYTGHRPTLKLPVCFPHQDIFMQTANRLEKLQDIRL